MKMRIGCSGWQYDEWKNKFYPKELAKKYWLKHYAQHFNTVELNSSFYRIPSENIINHWYQQVHKKFYFSIKVNRTITHYKKFTDTLDLLQNFYSIANLLKEKLGCVLFQFPQSVHYNPELLERIVDQLDVNKRNVLEFRHPSWWRDDVYDTLQNHNITFCTVSATNIPKQFIKSSDIFYMRLHGKRNWYMDGYNIRDLQKIVQWTKQNQFKECWIYFDNTANGNAPKNASMLLELFRKASKTSN